MFFNKRLGLRITPLGGVDIGQSCFLYQAEDAALVVDCGIKPGRVNNGGDQYWVQSPPDLTLLDKVLSEGKNVAGVITHAHLDHLGGVRELSQRKIPVHLSEWSKRFLERDALTLKVPLGAKIIVVPQGVSELAHDDFRISLFPIKHSIPGAFGLLIRARGKNVVHLTDFKANGLKNRVEDFEEVLENLKKEAGRIDCLLLDVMNSELEGFTSPESLAINEIAKIIQEKKSGRLIISCFSSNLRRIKGVIEAAQITGKKIGFTGYAMRLSERQIERYMGLELPVWPVEDCEVLFVSGSQGEENSVLKRMALGTHQFMRLTKNDKVIISARCIPENIEAVKSVLTNLNNKGVGITLNYGEKRRLGLNFEVEERLTHVSGHGSQEDMRLAVEILKPEMIIPIHAPPNKADIFEELVAGTWRVKSRVKRLKVGETLKV